MPVRQWQEVQIVLSWQPGDTRSGPLKNAAAQLQTVMCTRGNGKVYFINTTIGNRQYRPIKKNKDEKNSFFEIVVPLSLSGKKLDKWRQDRRRYTSQMAQRNVPNTGKAG